MRRKSNAFPHLERKKSFRAQRRKKKNVRKMARKVELFLLKLRISFHRENASTGSVYFYLSGKDGESLKIRVSDHIGYAKTSDWYVTPNNEASFFRLRRDLRKLFARKKKPGSESTEPGENRL